MQRIVKIESVDLNGQGVGHIDGKVTFIPFALPEELVDISLVKQKKSYNTARLDSVIQSSYIRVAPKCEYFGLCGGCLMQHMNPAAQVAIKQRALEDQLKHIGNVVPERIMAPIHGPYWKYRFRARLSVRYVQKKNQVLVGFRERNSRYVADMKSCQILPAHVSDLLPLLRVLIHNLSCYNRIPQIEVAVGSKTTVLVLRHLDELTQDDIDKLLEFAKANNISWWLQPKGPDTVHPLIPEEENLLFYDVPEFDLQMQFKPTDFTQVNHIVNRTLVSKAISYLDPKPNDRIIDLFCGLGNFTLPIARLAGQVIGVEGASSLTERATHIAQEHGLSCKTEFKTLNLFEVNTEWLRGLGRFDKVLIDPPREGALEISKALSSLSLDERPERVVYVSCNPATLARDAGIMVNVGKYKLKAAGVVNMFPHTGHVESIAIFE